MIRLTLISLMAATSLSFANLEIRHDQQGGHIEILDSGQMVTTYSYKDEAVKRPYFSNIKAPNGIQVTRNWPPREGIDPTDHSTMHPGIWMAFGRINDGDYWRNKSLIQHQRFVKDPEVSGDTVSFTVENAFIHEGKTRCIEQVTHSITRSGDGYLFNFDSHLLAIERLNFGDHQEMGLGIRLATPLRVSEGNGQILNSEGQVNEAEGWGRRAAWCDYSGTINGKRTGAILMPDPRNFRPSRFHSRDYGFTAANPFGQKDFDQGEEFVESLGRGKRLRLQFGVYVYSLPERKPLDHAAIYRSYLDQLGYVDKPEGVAWVRHTIDGGSRGADGVRLADINEDGLLDVTTGWEQGGEVRVYLNPGPGKAKNPWPMAVAGKVADPEDAVFVDLNGDGRLDVVSSTEGDDRTVYAHFAPSGPVSAILEKPWTTKAFPATQENHHWMFALPLQIDGKRGEDLVLGSKEEQAVVGWLQAPAKGERVQNWKWHKLTDTGWIMSLRAIDVNQDGLKDIVFSNRDNYDAGIWWMENPGPRKAQGPWNRHYIAGQGSEVMFMDTGDLNQDGLEDFVAATKDGDIVVALRQKGKSPTWSEETFPMPGHAGTGKGVAIGDIDNDGVTDLVVSCEHSENAVGVFWLKRNSSGKWLPRDISGDKDGVKFDRLELIDLDQDGDLDVMTCEERHNLGVIWYENPSI
ncbi:MAG: PmoA family protein [Verrucomicrobiae bacterium]|nr:PmoA family protein [Verrucomicrobiae bacterium]